MIVMKLFTFFISPAQNQHNKIKATLYKALFWLYCAIFTAETDRVKRVIKTLAWTNFKSIDCRSMTTVASRMNLFATKVKTGSS